MPFEIHPPEEGGIIDIRVWGVADMHTGHDARTAVVDLVRETGCKLIRVDFRETRIIAPLHEFMQYYAETAKYYPPGTRLALVIGEETVPEPEADMELARVVSLAGGIKLRDFRDMKKAAKWLKQA